MSKKSKILFIEGEGEGEGEGEAKTFAGDLEEYSPAKVFSKSPPDMKSFLTVHVKRVGGGDAPYVTLENVSPHTTVEELKNKIYYRSINTNVAASASQQPVPAERQRLIYAGRMLTDDNEVLGEGVKMKPGDVSFVHLVPIPEGKKLSSRNRNENKNGRKKSITVSTSRPQRRRERRSAAAPYSSLTQMVGLSAQRSAPNVVVSSSYVSPQVGTSTINAAAPSPPAGIRAQATASEFANIEFANIPAYLSTSPGATSPSAGYLSNRLLELTRAQQDATNLLSQSVGSSLAVASPVLGFSLASQQQPIALAESILQTTQMPSPPGQNNRCSAEVTNDVTLLSREAMPLHECLAPALRIVNEILENEARHLQQRNVGFPPPLESIVRPNGQQAQISSALQDVAELLERSSRQSDQLARLLRSIDVGASPGQVYYQRNAQPIVAPASVVAAPTAGLLAAAVGSHAFTGSISNLMAASAGNLNGSCDGANMDFLSSIARLL